MSVNADPFGEYYIGPESTAMTWSTVGPWETVAAPPRCKHRRHTCVDCGIGENDVMHKTIGGRGAVARLRRTK